MLDRLVMGYVLHEEIYRGLNDKSLKDLSLNDFAEEIFHRFYMSAKRKGLHIPYNFYSVTKREILDEVRQIYRIKYYGCFKLKKFTE